MPEFEFSCCLSVDGEDQVSAEATAAAIADELNLRSSPLWRGVSLWLRDDEPVEVDD